MKASNGGCGMSDEAVKGSAIMVFNIDITHHFSRFVDRYIPGYVFFGDIPASSSPKPLQRGAGLRLLVDETRRLVGLENF